MFSIEMVNERLGELDVSQVRWVDDFERGAGATTRYDFSSGPTCRQSIRGADVYSGHDSDHVYRNGATLARRQADAGVERSENDLSCSLLSGEFSSGAGGDVGRLVVLR